MFNIQTNKILFNSKGITQFLLQIYNERTIVIQYLMETEKLKNRGIAVMSIVVIITLFIYKNNIYDST